MGRTSRSKLREVDFRFEAQMFRGLEQNPETNSRWAQLARQRKKVMQFLMDRRYIASVVDRKVQFYGRSSRRERTHKPDIKKVGALESHCSLEPARMAQSWSKQFDPIRVK